jgi:hypothetical protein
MRDQEKLLATLRSLEADDSSGDDVQSHQDRVEERQRDKSQDRRAAKRPKFSSDDPSTWKVSDMWWV